MSNLPSEPEFEQAYKGVYRLPKHCNCFFHKVIGAD